MPAVHTVQDVEAWLRSDDHPDPRQIEIWRRMSGVQKLALAFEMYDFIRDMVRSHVQNEKPELSMEQIEALVRMRFARRD